MAEVEDTKEHHKQAEFAYNRPAYRESRWERAVKVYTVNQESRYLLVQNVHALGVTRDLLELFSLYGDIKEHRLLDEYPTEPYTDVYWIKFADINGARIAKKRLDNRSFFGKSLHVCYAPEFESVEDTREKLKQRRKVIAHKTREAFELAQKELQKNKGLPKLTPMTTSQPVVSVAAALPSSEHVTPHGTAIPSPTEEPPDSGLKSHVSGLVSHDSGLMSHDYHMPGIPQLPLLPLPPAPGGHQASVYPSTSATDSGGKADVRRSKPLQPSRIISRRTLEVGGQMNPTGLSRNDRLKLFLESSEVRVTASRTNPPAKAGRTVKGVALPVPTSRGQSLTSARDTAVPVQRSPKSIASINQTEMIPPRQAPGIQTGDVSLDKSVQAVRHQMTKVWSMPDVPIPKPKAKKRKRI